MHATDHLALAGGIRHMSVGTGCVGNYARYTYNETGVACYGCFLFVFSFVCIIYTCVKDYYNTYEAVSGTAALKRSRVPARPLLGEVGV